MEYELDVARDYYYVIRELVVHHDAGRSNDRSLVTVRKLCGAASAALEDAECRAALSAIDEHAARLFAGCDGAPEVRRQLLRDLEWFRARLFALEGAIRTAPP